MLAYAADTKAGGNAVALAQARGGEGGYGSFTYHVASANGGAGGYVSLNNAVNGYTNGGSLELKQYATGGAGGGSKYGAPGVGGGAASDLTYNQGVTATSASVTIVSSA